MLFVLLSLLLGNVIYTGLLYLSHPQIASLNYLYNISTGIFFALAAYIALRWRKKNKYGSLYVVAAIGSIAYFIGQVLWTYFNFKGIDIPYPSLSDFFYLIFYATTITCGIAVTYRLNKGNAVASVVETGIVWLILFLIVNSFLQENSIPSNPSIVATMLDTAYTLMDTFLISLSITAVRSHEGHMHPTLLYYMFGFVFLGFADTLFNFQVNSGTYWNGNYVDFLFSIAGFLFAMGTYYIAKLVTPLSSTSTPESV